MANSIAALNTQKQTLDYAGPPKIEILKKLNTSLWAQVDEDLVSLLEKVLCACGFAGTFQLTPLHAHKGTPHTRGMRFIAEHHDGITLKLHGFKTGNDGNIEVKLHKQGTMDAHEFACAVRQKLKEALGADTQPNTEGAPDVKTTPKSSVTAIVPNAPPATTEPVELPSNTLLERFTNVEQRAVRAHKLQKELQSIPAQRQTALEMLAEVNQREMELQSELNAPELQEALKLYQELSKLLCKR